jgi:hypothetical protein
MHESLGKHIKLLEIALKKEREKVRMMANGEPVDLGRDPKEYAKEQLNALGKRMFAFPAPFFAFEVNLITDNISLRQNNPSRQSDLLPLRSRRRNRPRTPVKSPSEINPVGIWANVRRKCTTTSYLDHIPHST